MKLSIVTPVRGREALMQELLSCVIVPFDTFSSVEWIVLDNSECKLQLRTGCIVRHVYVGSQPYSIGAMRNACARIASGDVILHMDSDDSYALGYIAESVDFLLASGKAVAGCHSLPFFDCSTDKVYRFTSQHKKYACGASLIYKRDWWIDHPFRNIQICEDNAFCDEARRHDQLASRSTDLLIARRNHEYGNTCRQKLEPPAFVEIPTGQYINRPVGFSTDRSA